MLESRFSATLSDGARWIRDVLLVVASLATGLLLRAGTIPRSRPGENTTLGIVATNATLTKTQATRVAQMAHDGFARAIYPSHTPNAGDVIFSLATGAKSGGDTGQIGELAAEMIADAIVRAARQATSVPGYPALRDLRP